MITDSIIAASRPDPYFVEYLDVKKQAELRAKRRAAHPDWDGELIDDSIDLADIYTTREFKDRDEARHFALERYAEDSGVRLVARANLRADPEYPGLWDWNDVEYILVCEHHAPAKGDTRCLECLERLSALNTKMSDALLRPKKKKKGKR